MSKGDGDMRGKRRPGLRRVWLISIALVFVACSNQGADVIFDVDAPPTDSDLIERVTSDLADTSDVELIGTVTGLDESVLIATFREEGEDCIAVYDESGYTSACGGLDDPVDGFVLMNGGDRDKNWMLLVVPDGTTEVRVTTAEAVTYSAPPVGSYAYIAFVRVDAPGVLSVWAGDELLYER